MPLDRIDEATKRTRTGSTIGPGKLGTNITTHGEAKHGGRATPYAFPAAFTTEAAGKAKADATPPKTLPTTQPG